MYIGVDSLAAAMVTLTAFKHDPDRGWAVCVACGDEFCAGDDCTYLPVGPGKDPEERTKARLGLPYLSAAIIIHLACATGTVNA